MRHFSYQTIDTTNKQALRNAELCPGNFYVTAASQSHGRGKDDRVWNSPLGNLYFSLGYRLQFAPLRIAQLTFVTAVVIANWLESQLLQQTIQCKWPNDVLINGKKIAGILLELHGQLLISGVGVNLSSYPAETTNLPATCMSDYTTVRFNPETVAADLATNLVVAYQTWQQVGFTTYRQQWLKRAYALGKRILVSNYATQAAPMCCVFQGIAEDGALLCQDSQQKVHSFYSADVTFLEH